jgi:hypothetical protein
MFLLWLLSESLLNLPNYQNRVRTKIGFKIQDFSFNKLNELIKKFESRYQNLKYSQNY